MSNKLDVGVSYLVRDSWTNNDPRKLTCLEITKTSYNIKWEKGYEVWITKKKFNDTLEILEKLEQQIPETAWLGTGELKSKESGV